MRNKKLFSTVVATALAATMAMPVMAADGGSVDVDVTTKTGVLRVQVPTTLAVAVDQFEIANAGAQIYSEEFPMTNLSEIAVKVDVTSTVELGTDISLASSKTATKGNEAWLAAAAMTASSSYDIADTADVTENAWDLSEANANVATFGADKTASQTFYLEKATGTATYKLAVPDADGKVGEAFARFYELTAIGTQPTNEAELKAEVDKGDVYAVVTTDAGKDGTSVTKLEKGSIADASGSIFAATNTYYTMAEEPTVLDATANGKVFVYAAMGTAGSKGAAGFTYIGKLSDEREKWDDNDIKNIKIEYTINGVTASKYDEVKGDCTYGFYPEAAQGPQVSVDGNGLITLTNFDGTTYASLSLNDGTDDWPLRDADGTWVWDKDDPSSVKTFQLGSGWVPSYLAGKDVTIIVNLKDGTKLTSSVVTFPTS